MFADIELFHMYTKKHTLPNLCFEITIIKAYEKNVAFYHPKEYNHSEQICICWCSMLEEPNKEESINIHLFLFSPEKSLTSLKKETLG